MLILAFSCHYAKFFRDDFLKTEVPYAAASAGAPASLSDEPGDSSPGDLV
jgi:hypothetical protein